MNSGWVLHLSTLHVKTWVAWVTVAASVCGEERFALKEEVEWEGKAECSPSPVCPGREAFFLGLFALQGSSLMQSFPGHPLKSQCTQALEKAIGQSLFSLLNCLFCFLPTRFPGPALTRLFCMNYIPQSHKSPSSSSPFDSGLCVQSIASICLRSLPSRILAKWL